MAGRFADSEFIKVHDAAFGFDRSPDEDWRYRKAVEDHSLGWVTARIDDELVDFAKVPGMAASMRGFRMSLVDPVQQRRGIGAQLVALAAEAARDAGC
jgi:GNAT superfamily N-acetyltransferase